MLISILRACDLIGEDVDMGTAVGVADRQVGGPVFNSWHVQIFFLFWGRSIFVLFSDPIPWPWTRFLRLLWSLIYWKNRTWLKYHIIHDRYLVADRPHFWYRQRACDLFREDIELGSYRHRGKIGNWLWTFTLQSAFPTSKRNNTPRESSKEVYLSDTVTSRDNTHQTTNDYANIKQPPKNPQTTYHHIQPVNSTGPSLQVKNFPFLSPFASIRPPTPESQ